MTEILVGQVVGAHGVRGMVKVAVITQKPEKRFAKGRSLWLAKPGRWFEVESVQPHQSILLVKFAGVDDRDAAIALFPSEIRIAKAELEPLPEGEYYYFELLGLSVYSEGAFLGTLSDILETGANDVYVIAREGKKDLLVPALKDVIQKTDLSARRLDVKLPAGLLECYE